MTRTVKVTISSPGATLRGFGRPKALLHLILQDWDPSDQASCHFLPEKGTEVGWRQVAF
jgi:hypothetical protein